MVNHAFLQGKNILIVVIDKRAKLGNLNSRVSRQASQSGESLNYEKRTKGQVPTAPQ
ncbi:MAG: hypothetical protein F6J93_24405 [Oscillatoria sp. SIO1A7]|nr:hypothetical protein [Oscillatoria sp. SIO1A7]